MLLIIEVFQWDLKELIATLVLLLNQRGLKMHKLLLGQKPSMPYDEMGVGNLRD